MKLQELNRLPEKYLAGEISQKQLINLIACFVAENYPVYGLHKYDEDFRQDIILYLIEKGPHLLHIYNPEFGDFFTFLYCYISTLINTKIKNCVMNNMKEKLTFEESVRSLDEKAQKYHKIDYKNFEVQKAPFAHKKITPEELHDAVKELSQKQTDKKVIILALKSSYYLTDEQIQRICSIYHIDQEHFYNMVQHCKETLLPKSERRERAEERRNFAYYHHKRYLRIIKNLDEDDLIENKYILKEIYENKERKHRQNWNRMNNIFEKGHLYMRPTTKTVADLMGICERQVNYYLNCVKKDLKKLEDNLTSDEDDCS